MKKEIVKFTKDEMNAKKIELAKLRVGFVDAQTKANQMRALKKSIARSLSVKN
ncbi:MAG TPA: hypothetical protein VGE63_03035 [Candidatus Paceibacterota bacterium]